MRCAETFHVLVSLSLQFRDVEYSQMTLVYTKPDCRGTFPPHTAVPSDDRRRDITSDVNKD